MDKAGTKTMRRALTRTTWRASRARARARPTGGAEAQEEEDGKEDGLHLKDGAGRRRMAQDTPEEEEETSHQKETIRGIKQEAKMEEEQRATGKAADRQEEVRASGKIAGPAGR